MLQLLMLIVAIYFQTGAGDGNKKRKKKKKKRAQRVKEMKEEAQAKIHNPATPVDEDVLIDWKTEGIEKSNPTFYIFNKIFDR